MERYCMQNHYTCRSNRMSENRSMQNRPFSGDCFDDTAIYKHADHLPLTMAYVPMQKFSGTFSIPSSYSARISYTCASAVLLNLVFSM